MEDGRIVAALAGNPNVGKAVFLMLLQKCISTLETGPEKL